MTPDEVRKGCGLCRGHPRPCLYHKGYQDGYEAAQRERDEDSMTHYPGKLTWDPLPVSPGMPRPTIASRRSAPPPIGWGAPHNGQ